MNTIREDRPISTVAADIIGNVSDMVRSEVQLARVEIKVEALKAAKSGSLIGSGIVVGLYAVGLLIAVAVLLLSRVLEAWLAALVVCAALCALAGTLVVLGRQRWKRLHLTPDKTVQTFKENVSWMKAQVK